MVARVLWPAKLIRQGVDMHVFIISLEYSPEISGGVGTQVQELSLGLTRMGDTVTVIACTLGEGKVLSEPGRAIYLVPPDITRRTNAAGATSITGGILDMNARLLDYARQHVIPRRGLPDIIQCYNWLTFPAASELSRLWGVPVVSTIQFVSEPAERYWGQTPDPQMVEMERQTFQRADALIAVSHSLKTMVCATYGVESEKIHVVYNGMDVKGFTGAEIDSAVLESLRRQLAPKNEKLVLFAGRLNPHKGIEAILGSIGPVLKDQPHTKYVFIGEPDTKEFATFLNTLRTADPLLKGRILFLGKLPRRKLLALYRVSDVALVPSVYDFCPYAAIEAMAVGVPLVATAVGGLAELITHGQTGLLVPVDTPNSGKHIVDVGQLAAATTLLLSNAELGRHLASAARVRAMSMLDIQHLTRATRDVYSTALANKAGKAA